MYVEELPDFLIPLKQVSRVCLSQTSLLAINAIATPPYCGCHAFLFVECGLRMRHRQRLDQIDRLEHELEFTQLEAMELSRFPCE
jgi:hypothetical protein